VSCGSTSGAVGGGAFYDGTLFPGTFRGNFFFPDYVDNRVVHAVLDAGDGGVVSVDHFATTQAAALDLEVGPDGALYLMRYGGQIVRYGYASPAQGIVVSEQHVRFDEGDERAVSVRLATQPDQETSVDIVRSAADADLSVTQGGGADLHGARLRDATARPVPSPPR
jgi:hypothetical protein